MEMCNPAILQDNDTINKIVSPGKFQRASPSDA